VKRRDRRSDCPINYALQTFGDSWSLLILRDLVMMGKRTFGEFVRSEERISTNVLTTRLRALEEAGLILSEGEGPSVRYSLTPKGLDLLPVLLELVAWSARYDPRTAAPRRLLTRIRNDRAALIDELRAQVSREHGFGDGSRRASPATRRR
jgi:DNA-binding HxlR family transcriptional regulator